MSIVSKAKQWHDNFDNWTTKNEFLLGSAVWGTAGIVCFLNWMDNNLGYNKQQEIWEKNRQNQQEMLHKPAEKSTEKTVDYYEAFQPK